MYRFLDVYKGNVVHLHENVFLLINNVVNNC